MDINNGKLVIVSSDEDLSQAIRKAFEDSGLAYDLVFVPTLQEARLAIFQCNPMVVVADYQLEDGQATDLWKTDDYNYRFDLIIMVSSEDREVGRDAIRNGAAAYLVKEERTLCELPWTVEQMALQFSRTRNAMRQAFDEATGCEDQVFDAYTKLKERDQLIQNGPAIMIIARAEPDLPIEFVTDNITGFGYMPDQFYSGEVKLPNLIHADDSDLVRAQMTYHASKRHCSKFRQQYRINTGYGGVIPVESWTWMRRDAERNITHYQLMLLDITERCKREHEISEQERRYHDIVESIDEWVWEVDIDGRITYTSPQVRDVLGYRPIQVDTHNIREFLVGEEESPLFLAMIKSQTSALPFANIESHFVTEPGDYLALKSSCVPFSSVSGEILGFRCVSRDMSDTHRLAQIMNENRHNLHAVIRDLSTPMALLDRKTMSIIDCNRSLVGISGFLLDEIVGQPVGSTICRQWSEELEQNTTASSVCQQASVLSCKDGDDIPVMLKVISFAVDEAIDFLICEFILHK